MKQKKLLAALALLIGTSGSALASVWFSTSIGNEDSSYYFDAETIEKTREQTTIWIKSVRMNTPDSDGSWATASRWRLDCVKRTIQSLTSSDYDRDGKFIKSYPKPGREEAAVPDSIGEAILKMACAADFPRNKAAQNYWRLESNDVFQATRNYSNYLKSKKDPAPQ